ncbi:hypothetical protein D3C73_450800 [compost metagenome]
MLQLSKLTTYRFRPIPPKDLRELVLTELPEKLICLPVPVVNQGVDYQADKKVTVYISSGYQRSFDGDSHSNEGIFGVSPNSDVGPVLIL